MHLLIGFVLARLLKQSKNRGTDLPTLRGKFEVAHRLPGRIRFRVPLLESQSTEVVDTLRKELLKLPEIESVEINTYTAGLTVEFDESAIDADIVCGVLLKLLGYEDLAEQLPESIAHREIKAAGSALNQQVYNATAGVLDLPSGVAVAVFLIGLYMIIARGDRRLPGGFSLLWWAYVIFKSKGP